MDLGGGMKALAVSASLAFAAVLAPLSVVQMLFGSTMFGLVCGFAASWRQEGEILWNSAGREAMNTACWALALSCIAVLFIEDGEGRTSTARMLAVIGGCGVMGLLGSRITHRLAHRLILKRLRLDDEDDEHEQTGQAGD